ncbi:MAG: potassium-transporting ATPase subunit C [Candidatus Thermoplasmatota archaeon]|jgi:K+-transporting ATPase ATPase C chain|nr:potassium-transporting ATPase subunit C [Candidatus Thermoplasmatota archaeon]MCL5963558.1 potassium-transporting ATPase subunit C [Candidatus Thermoplasmatota archaeon]
MKYIKHVRGSITLLFSMLIIVSVIYPFATAYISTYVYHSPYSNVPVIYHNGTAIGSPDMVENFTQPWFFHPRPSMTDYFSLSSNSSSNYGPVSPVLYNFTLQLVKKYYGGYISFNNTTTTIPINMVSYSSSGVDPDITILSALIQIPRISHYSGIPQKDLLSMVTNNTVAPFLTVVGIPYVNIVTLNTYIYDIMQNAQ